MDIMIINLANLDVRIDFDRLNTEHFKRPVSRKAHISEARSHMDKQAQPARGGAAFKHGHILVRFGKFVCPAQIQPVRLQHQPVLRNDESLRRIQVFHIKDAAFIDQQLVCQRQVIAVGVDSFFIERFDDDLFADVFEDFFARKYHKALSLSRFKGSAT